MKLVDEILDITEADVGMSTQEFIKSVTTAFRKEFPKAWFEINHSINLTSSISLSFGVMQKGKVANKIRQNDPGFHTMHVWNVPKNGFIDNSNLQLELGTGGKIMIKPSEGSHLAFDGIKIGFRKKKGNAKQVLKTLTDYFKKTKKVLMTNIDNLKGVEKSDLGI